MQRRGIDDEPRLESQVSERQAPKSESAAIPVVEVAHGTPLPFPVKTLAYPILTPFPPACGLHVTYAGGDSKAMSA